MKDWSKTELMDYNHRFTLLLDLCYFKALQLGDASKVVPVDKFSIVITLVMAAVFLHEQFTVKTIIGSVLITFGDFYYDFIKSHRSDV